MDERHIASIDLGTSKIGLCVAKVKGNDVQVVYYKETPSQGIRNSEVVNPKKASDPLREAIRAAEEELMIKIMQVVVGMPRKDVSQITAAGKIMRTSPNEYITEEEVENLKEMAIEQYPLEDTERQIIYGAVAQSFSIEDQIQLVEDDVIGTLSNTLEGDFKVFVGSRMATVAVDMIFNKMGIAVAKKYFLPDVVARTVLTHEERENGVALVDVGGGVTSVSIYHRGIMRYYASIPFGGKSITGDIRSEAGISEQLAERIKCRFGACQPGKLASLSEKVLHIFEGETSREVSVKFLSEVIDCRSREIIEAILYYIQESGLQNTLRSGVVLTGGGTNLTNFGNLFKEMSGYEIRTGYPRHLFSSSAGPGVYDPSATAALGMVLAAKEDHLPDCVSIPESPEEEEAKPTVQERPAEGDRPEVPPVEAPDTATDVPASDSTPAGEGTIFRPEDMGETKPPVTRSPGKPRRNNRLTILWTKAKQSVRDSVIDFYDEYNKDEVKPDKQ